MFLPKKLGFIDVLSTVSQKLISQATLKTDFVVNNRPIVALRLSKEAYLMMLWHFVRGFIKMIVFQVIAGHWKSAYFSVMKYLDS